MKPPDDIVTPDSFIGYLKESLRLDPAEIRLPRRGVIVFGSEDFETFRRAIRGKRASWSPSQCSGHAGRNRVFVGRSHIGGPAAALVAEEMAARGVRDYITFGACGSLLPDLPIGSVVVPTFAYPDDGTSRHYGAPRRPRPNPALLAAIRAACRARAIPCREGGVWTTDAPYRESRTEAAALAKQGIIAVEMEAAAVYAVARYRGLRAASLMVVSDELAGEGWNPGFLNPAFRRAKRNAIRAVVDALSRPWP